MVNKGEEEEDRSEVGEGTESVVLQSFLLSHRMKNLVKATVGTAIQVIASPSLPVPECYRKSQADGQK